MDSYIILLNKERGISSNSAVNRVKYAVGANKAGHLGTLDVLATGLLPITINKATKLFDYYLNKDKVYRAVFRFGETTDTLDLEGEITEKVEKVITLEMVEAVLPQFTGKINQMPPVYSAKKVNGKKAYQLARSGKDVQLKPKEIEIYSLKCLGEIDQNTFEFEIHCSSGTYIRSLCRDIATALSTIGVMSSLQRTKCGVFNVNDAFLLNDIKSGNYKKISLENIFDFDKISIDEVTYQKLVNGVNPNYFKNGMFRCYFNDNYIGNVSVVNNKMKFAFRLV